MKNLKLLLVTGIAAFTISCSKDDDAEASPVVFQEENTFQALMGQPYIADVFPILGTNVLEMGFDFKAKYTGKITALIVKLPAAKANLLITIWDTESHEVIRTESVNIVAASTAQTFEIMPIILEKDHSYTLSFESKDMFNHDGSNSVIAPFPFDCGSIDVTRFVYTDNEYGFPNNDGYSDMYGDVAFKFIRTE